MLVRLVVVPVPVVLVVGGVTISLQLSGLPNCPPSRSLPKRRHPWKCLPLPPLPELVWCPAAVCGSCGNKGTTPCLLARQHALLAGWGGRPRHLRIAALVRRPMGEPPITLGTAGPLPRVSASVRRRKRGFVVDGVATPQAVVVRARTCLGRSSEGGRPASPCAMGGWMRWGLVGREVVFAVDARIHPPARASMLDRSAAGLAICSVGGAAQAPRSFI